MTKETQKVESVKNKRFTVLENGTEVLNFLKKEEATEAVKMLQKEFKPMIILIDNQEKVSTHYKKTIHEKNYRIVAGNYEKDIKPKAIAEVTETVK